MPEYDLWARKVCHIYLARPVDRLGDPVEPDHEAVWMPVETATVEAAVEGDRHFLDLVARGLRREFWPRNQHDETSAQA